jgi:AcrR family transcriptional regulator
VILAAAAEEFTRAGYQRARVSDIAAAVGVTEPVVFQNFGSKASLYAAVLDRAADQLADLLHGQVTEAGSVRAFLEDVLAPGHLDRMHRRGNPGVLFADAVGLTADPEIEDAARRSVRRVARAFAALFEEGQRTGELRRDLDPATAAWWLLSFFASHVFRQAVMPMRASREADLARLTLQTLLG